MNVTSHRLFPLAVIGLWWCLAAWLPAQVSSRLNSRFLARGEVTLLEVSLSGFQPTEIPALPAVEGFEIRPTGRGVQTRLLPGRRLEYVFSYLISSYETGAKVVPPFDVMAGGVRMRTEPIGFTVFNPDQLEWAEARVGETGFRYACAFRTGNAKPFVGETLPVEIKLYIPRDLFIDDYGIPDFERDGVTAWRFQPNPSQGEVNLLGLPYQAVAYPSTLTPSREGAVGIGPAKVRLVARLVEIDGFQRWVNREVYLNVPKLALDAVPLPEGAPEGFDNAVGNFRMEVTAGVVDVQEGDPIPVEIVVRGSGNLDTLRPPKPVSADGWKVYEPTTEQRGTERHELEGSTVFKQFLRPLEMKSELPAFRFVYFDPAEKTYQTIASNPIPLSMKPAAAMASQAMAPPQALAVPVERMTDILGLVEPSTLTRTPGSGLRAWHWHLAAGMLALVLVGKALWMPHGHRFQRDPVRARRLQELREVAGARDLDDAGFLLRAGAFIERWLGGNPAPEVRAVLAERDALCFRGQTPREGVLGPERRREILRALRKASLLWVVATVLLGGTHRATAAAPPTDIATAAREAYDAARYDEAIRLWLTAGPYESLTADTLYNIGNACYRAGSPGHAALYYRRALAREAGHPEARQNLRFIERKYGSITILRPDYQYALARLPLSGWQAMLWGGLWLCGLAGLAFPATRPGARIRLAAATALVAGPLLAACGGLGWRYYPNDAEFSPVARQAVITGDKAVLHADASRTSPEVIDAPPGSLCEVVRESGRWAYVAFATKTRGWVTLDSIERVVPATPPKPPRIRKPKADGKSA